MVAWEREFLDWNEEEDVYIIDEVSSKPFDMVEVERSLREQGFGEYSSDVWNLHLRSHNVEFFYTEEEDYMMLDFNGHELSDMRELETFYSLEEGHTVEADSLNRIYWKEVEDNTRIY